MQIVGLVCFGTSLLSYEMTTWVMMDDGKGITRITQRKHTTKGWVTLKKKDDDTSVLMRKYREVFDLFFTGSN